MGRYAVIKDLRTEKLYIDFSDELIRNFETIVDNSDNKDELTEKYPDAIDLVTCDPDFNEDMDGDFDSAMTSAGFGTDEDYGFFDSGIDF